MNLELIRLIDKQYTRTPFYGSHKMTQWLRREGLEVNHKRIAQLMREWAFGPPRRAET